MNAVAVYERVLFAPRASAPWIRGRELGFETWERTNTDIYKHGICPKIYTAGFFRLKILHHQFHLISTILVGKTQKLRKNGEIYTAGKNFKLPPAVTAVTNLTSARLLLLQKRQSRPKYHRPNFMFISAGQLNHKQLTVSERISSTTRISLLRFQRHRFGK